MELVFQSKKEANKINKDIKKALVTLYYLEDFTEYKEETISNCIDLLQDTKILYRNKNRNLLKLEKEKITEKEKIKNWGFNI